MPSYHTAPAHPHATDAAVYTALFFFQQSSFFKELLFRVKLKLWQFDCLFHDKVVSRFGRIREASDEHSHQNSASEFGGDHGRSRGAPAGFGLAEEALGGQENRQLIQRMPM